MGNSNYTRTSYLMALFAERYTSKPNPKRASNFISCIGSTGAARQRLRRSMEHSVRLNPTLGEDLIFFVHSKLPL